MCSCVCVCAYVFVDSLTKMDSWISGESLLASWLAFDSGSRKSLNRLFFETVFFFLCLCETLIGSCDEFEAIFRVRKQVSQFFSCWSMKEDNQSMEDENWFGTMFWVRKQVSQFFSCWSIKEDNQSMEDENWFGTMFSVRKQVSQFFSCWSIKGDD